MERKKPEILAPAGSAESLRAAVAAGCDAVYIGGDRFGARAFADNPTEAEMVQAIEYCHLHGVKLYLTVNTLLKEQELKQELFSYLLPYYKAGLNAVIVQDLGVLRMIHQWFPDLEVHASTQMNLTSGKGVKVLEKYGVTRIVPARELTLQEIGRMRQDTDLEIEVFVHGALCYCYSGQCLLSSMQGGRSGNRGRCAQPCRMLYRYQGKAAYYLSPKELCNLPYVGELTEIGVDSFKIEGRMKRPEYTALVTSLYRKYVDLYYDLGKEGYGAWMQAHQKEWQEDMEDLAEIYNRSGFTQGYLEGRAGVFAGKEPLARQMLSEKRPRHGGVLVGKVVSVDARTASFVLQRAVSPQDILEFRDQAQRTLYEYTVGNGAEIGEIVRARYQKGCHIHVEDLVYRTRRQVLLDRIRESYLETEQKLPVEGKFSASAGERSRLSVRIGDCLVTVEGNPVEPASKRPAEREAVQRSLGQTGDSPFFFAELEVALHGEVFLPVGELKKLRREALRQLQEALLDRKRRTWSEARQEIVENDVSHAVAEKGVSETVSVAVMSWEQLEAAIRVPWVTEVILRMDQIEDYRVAEGIRLIQSSGKRAVLGLPAIFRSPVWEYYESKDKKLTDIFYHSEPDGYLVRNLESFAFLREVLSVDAEKIMTDTNLYVINEEAIRWWEEQGVMRMTAPLELTGREWESLALRSRLQVIVYGHLPLMLSAQCVACNTSHCAVKEQASCRQTILSDEKRRQFIAVNYCKYCYNVIYQGIPLRILDQRKRLAEAGFAGYRYEFTVESGQETAQMLRGDLPPQGKRSLETERGHFELGIE